MDAEPDAGDLAALEGRFRFHRRLEIEAEARDLEEERARSETFHDFLTGLRGGLVVGLVTRDGAEIWGRVDAVGVDKIRLAETGPLGHGAANRRPRRIHDIPMWAVARVIREATEWR